MKSQYNITHFESKKENVTNIRLLLGHGVLDEVYNSVAVPKLVIIPETRCSEGSTLNTHHSTLINYTTLKTQWRGDNFKKNSKKFWEF